MHDKTIRITQTQTGWIVILPYIHQSQPSYGVIPEKEIRRQARIAKSEYLKDDELEAIREKQEQNPAKEYREKNAYTFATFAEVIAFLKIELNQ